MTSNQVFRAAFGFVAAYLLWTVSFQTFGPTWIRITLLIVFWLAVLGILYYVMVNSRGKHRPSMPSTVRSRLQMGFARGRMGARQEQDTTKGE